MTHDELVRVFPNGRTVYLPSDGVPLKGYDLAKADIERRGDGEHLTGGSPSFLAALFGSKSAHEDDDADSAPLAYRKPAATVAAAATAKPADSRPVPAPRPRPQLAATLQLTAADSQLVQLAQQGQVAPASNDTAQARPANGKRQTPADVINDRSYEPGGGAARQAAPAEAVRKAITSTNPPPGDAPPPPRSVGQANAGAATPHRPLLQAQDPALATGISSVAPKGPQGGSGRISISARIAAANGGSAWLRMMMLVPSVGNSMSVTMLGNADLTRMTQFFAKEMTINASFTDDPMRGVSYDHFSGSATAKPDGTSFMLNASDLH